MAQITITDITKRVCTVNIVYTDSLSVTGVKVTNCPIRKASDLKDYLREFAQGLHAKLRAERRALALENKTPVAAVTALINSPFGYNEDPEPPDFEEI